MTFSIVFEFSAPMRSKRFKESITSDISLITPCVAAATGIERWVILSPRLRSADRLTGYPVTVMVAETRTECKCGCRMWLPHVPGRFRKLGIGGFICIHLHSFAYRLTVRGASLPGLDAGTLALRRAAGGAIS